ncbi:MAG: hypothetical protein QNK89_04880 [Lacinutrix sp.]|uniref:hypothetical protein n=1 Tax=Lacinutrix sp. TaxID=1937692 RepID=UPI0030A5C432
MNNRKTILIIGICILNPFCALFVNGVMVTKEPIEAPNPVSRYGDTYGIGKVSLIFPPSIKAFAVDLKPKNANVSSLISEEAKIIPA